MRLIDQTAVFLGITLRQTAFALALVIGLVAQLSVHADSLDGESRVLGFQKCVDCHELPAEAWLRSSHANRSLSMLSTNSRALRYARRLDIAPSEISRDSICTDCHGTRQQTVEGTVQVVHGVSCESCHGPAGTSLASGGWYGLHSGEEEPEDADVDLAVALQEAGMAGASDLYSLAVRCYECHSVSNEKVVAAGHMAGTSDFELATWFSGEVRHNFAPYTVDVENDEMNMHASNVWLAKQEGRDPASRKRLMYVVGQLADLEVSLRNRGNATREGTFATAAAGRSVAALARLEQIAKQSDIVELREATAAVESVRELLFLPPHESQESVFAEASDGVAHAARAFMAKYDGAQLEAIEQLLPRETKGQAFQP